MFKNNIDIICYKLVSSKQGNAKKSKISINMDKNSRREGAN